jgi:hypothetical protein
MAAMAGRKFGGHNQDATGKFSACVTGSALTSSGDVACLTMYFSILA